MGRPYYQDNHRTVYNKPCMDMSEIPDESIQCCVTSPPYWGLRKYSGEQDIPEWGCSYGLEPTPELYVEHTIEILREIRRVLRKDGVVFWNIGDSYYNYRGENNRRSDKDLSKRNTLTQDYHNIDARPNEMRIENMKPKDLCLIPFRVAIAAQEDGWYVRSDIIWSKPNPMPESVKDRPTNSHEHIFLFTKSSKYYWDQDAVREDGTGRNWAASGGNLMGSGVHKLNDGYKDIGNRSNREDATGRNIRSVWEFPTQPYKEAHFAVFPEKLPETCIKAGSKEGDTILDPFAGSGTTLLVASKLGRMSVGYELSEEYCRLIVERNKQQCLL